ncbi:TauD/TfdA family dioxygenase [uncultured Sphingomonas sp.]|uniref:TauD/TfdA family dioxygenase n=1 Tax=uncultured Sphingomonas sp. TaxID=158754 RepID=UPI0025ED74EB|nr:TauD/TfdA family dioxygenase [uncultured Sphingomonas sp.]
MHERPSLADIVPLDDAQLGGIVAENVSVARQMLAEQGVCLLRNAATSIGGFHDAILGFGLPLAERYGDLPRFGERGIFRVTPYPAKEDLLFHNEASHTPTAPRFIFFYCHQPAPEGGNTPFSDGARALAELDDGIVDALHRRGLLYRRRFIPGLDVAWQDFFGTHSPEEVERQCLEHGLAAEWDQDVLQTDFRTTAISRSCDGAYAMFHQIALHHPAFLPEEVREYFETCDAQGRTPRDVLFGDGTPIPDAWARAIVTAQLRAARSFIWRSGDILALNNRIFAHARARHRGPRENYVILGELEAV